MKPQEPPALPGADQPSPGSRDRAWGLVIANQLALPGLGTYLAGRRTAGLLQMILAFAGVIAGGVFLAFAIPHFGDWWNPPDDPDLFLENVGRWIPWLAIGGGGLALFGIAWCWAWGTSAKVMKSSRNPRRP